VRPAKREEGKSSEMKRLPVSTPIVATWVLLLAGCVTAPTPDNAQKAWVPPASESRAGDPIWEALRQRAIDPVRPITLAELTDLALRQTAATRKAWNAARAAAAQVDHAQGLFMPTLTATAGGSRSGVTASPKTYSYQMLQGGPGLQINYLVINFGGGREAAVEEALQTVYAADYTFNQTIQDVLLAVEMAYYGVISAQSGIDAAVANVADAQKALDVAKARATAGLGTDLDVLQTQASLDQALYNEAVARGQHQIARGQLAQAVGLPADTPMVVALPSSDLPPQLLKEAIRQIVDDAIQRRPDMAALRASFNAKMADIKVAHAASWPSLYVNGYANRSYNDIFSGAPQQADRSWSYGAGASMQWTLFDGWQTESSIRTAEAAAASARNLLEQAELAASADVWTSFQNYDTALRKYALSQAFLASAESAHATAMAAYKAGLRTLLDLLNAEAQLTAARSQQVASRQDVFTALSGLAHSTGLLVGGDIKPTTQLFVQPLQKENHP